jgi:hypothetical protein
LVHEKVGPQLWHLKCSTSHNWRDLYIHRSL